MKSISLPRGVLFAFGAAALFGLSTPFSKLLLEHTSPLLLAGLLYLGSGVGLSLVRWLRRGEKSEAALSRRDWPWLGGAVLFGGALGPVLLMIGLSHTTAATASLLLNLEGVFTALLAWFAFRENFDRRIALGMALIVAGGVLLSYHPGSGLTLAPGALAVAGACLCWGIDNNLTQKVSSSDPFQIAAIKGLVAGSVNLVLALLVGARFPAWPVLSGALVVGFLGYGLSLACFVLALRLLGTARTGAYFSLAPFLGALVSLVILREGVGPLFFGSALLMGAGVWLHLSEKHGHKHVHERLEHAHSHTHDEHHQHDHAPDIDPAEPHSHLHVHEPLTHLHAHFPDIHHRHEHSPGEEASPIQDRV
jgi:drug/metabolite transporter (DMT)-like permease